MTDTYTSTCPVGNCARTVFIVTSKALLVVVEDDLDVATKAARLYRDCGWPEVRLRSMLVTATQRVELEQRFHADELRIRSGLTIA